ncbi:SDR family oxidoreductase [Pseudanabaena sp. FACHB-2040]|uniref:SDR family oxidoreductase n=1 Tax=Pseudanabaena sp. FACHB-2040 TaxID=2692859 RepID=UPI0016883A49|nr:SDR family oxidoreductase [Pseudanabaena sp. FACHB-2040]MBD2261170.1 SDR family oxidoreductase [Pseudanabaena sp. FACHB-2040]
MNKLSRSRRGIIKSAAFAATGLALGAGASSVQAKPAVAQASVQPTAQPQLSTALPLAGKVAFVTGAARGIGRAISEVFALNGADVAMLDIADPARLNSSRGYRVADMDEFNAASESVKQYGTKVLQIQVDVRDLAAMQAAAERTARELGGIDIVVANAGYVAWHSFEEGTPQLWHDVFDVNVHGVFNTAKAAIPFLKRRGGGRIINMASVSSRAGFAGNGAYTSTKWAVVGMTKQAAQELGQYNITVNAIAPGAVNTPMYRGEGQMRSMGVSTPEEQDALINPISPLGNAGALEPQDIAQTALFLASDAAKTISGTTIDNALGFNASYTA